MFLHFSMRTNPKPNKSRFTTHLILPEHMKECYKIKKQGALGSYFCLKMISKLSSQTIFQRTHPDIRGPEAN